MLLLNLFLFKVELILLLSLLWLLLNLLTLLFLLLLNTSSRPFLDLFLILLVTSRYILTCFRQNPLLIRVDLSPLTFIVRLPFLRDSRHNPKLIIQMTVLFI